VPATFPRTRFLRLSLTFLSFLADDNNVLPLFAMIGL
jgi:hypothetical protein